MAELDAEVIRVARQHLKSVHRGALDDRRLEIRLGDGWDTVSSIAQRGAERFDLVLLDLTDPDTPAFRLYTPEFFQLCRSLLNEGGALVLHIGSPIFKPERVGALLVELGKVFRLVRPMGLYVPLYGTYWGLAVASDGLDPRALTEAEVERRLAERAIGELEYYNGATHQALFALPNFYRRLLP
jgi:spermidine synthase